MNKGLPVFASVFLLLAVISTMQPTYAASPPVAEVKGPYWAGIGNTVQFDGSGSYDPDGFSMTYEWDFGDGSPRVTGTDLKNPTHIYSANGVYIITLTVTDQEGLTDSDQARVDITDPYCRIVAHKWNDANNNGAQDAGEEDIEGWQMEVYISEDFGATWTYVATGLTGPDGTVTFDIPDTGASDTRIVEEQRPGWINTTSRTQETYFGAYITYTVYFGNMQFPQHVIPEVPLGSIVASLTMIIALISYLTIPRLRAKQTGIKT